MYSYLTIVYSIHQKYVQALLGVEGENKLGNK